jgi:hypothetical protein
MGIKLTTRVRNSKNTSTPGVDGKINIVKERVRTTLLDLPYNLPPYLLKYCVAFIVSRMNMIRSSPFTLLSPKEILTGTKLDQKRDLRLSFGDFVQVNVPHSSDPLSEKTTSCIALQPCMDQYGSISQDEGRDKKECLDGHAHHRPSGPLHQPTLEGEDTTRSTRSSDQLIGNWKPPVI